MRVVIEQIEEALSFLPRSYFDSARAPQRGVVDARVQPIVQRLIHNQYLRPRGTGPEAVWLVGDERRAEVDDLWRGLQPDVAEALVSAAQRAAAIAVAWSKTA